MFLGVEVPRLFFRDPLALGIEERLEMLRAGERRIVYFFDPALSAYRYRAVNMVQSLLASPATGISASWFTPSDLGRMDAFVDRADVLVICRTPYDASIERVVSRAKTRDIPVLFDIDDLVFDVSYIGLVLDMLGHDIKDSAVWDHWFASFGRLGATLNVCDGAIVATGPLVRQVEHFAPEVKSVIIPNFLNRAQQCVSRRIFAKKLQSNFARDARIHIGYFSGTPTHNRDFAVASDVLMKLMKSDRRLTLRIVGPLDLGILQSEYPDRIDRHPLRDFINLQSMIGSVEINIAPLMENAYTHCKSNLKFFEAATVGTITVSSSVDSFRTAIRDNVNGFLAEPGEWESKIGAALAVVENAADYREMAQLVFQDAERDHGWDKFAARIDAAVFGHPALREHQNESARPAHC